MGPCRALILLLGGLTVAYAEAPTVTLDTGIWKGVPTQLAGSSTIVHKYLGLPFAAPPVRFSRPQLPVKSTAQKDANTLPPACIQNGGGSFTAKSPQENED